MKKLVLLLTIVSALVIFGCTGSEDEVNDSGQILRTESYIRGPYGLELSYPADEIDFGSKVEFILRIEYPENESYILLPPAVGDGEIYSNTLIEGINQSEPVLNGNGSAVSIITFNVEAWLPGELVFPPLTVSFGEELSTEQIILPVSSAFENPEELRELSPLYIPAADNSQAFSFISAVAAAAVVLTAAAAVIIFVRRRRKKKSVEAEPEKTREELMEDFRKKYIEPEEVVDLRAAFEAYERIPGGTAKAERHRKYIDEARFSKNSISEDDGRRILTELYLQLTMEGFDEF